MIEYKLYYGVTYETGDVIYYLKNKNSNVETTCLGYHNNSLFRFVKDYLKEDYIVYKPLNINIDRFQLIPYDKTVLIYEDIIKNLNRYLNLPERYKEVIDSHNDLLKDLQLILVNWDND